VVEHPSLVGRLVTWPSMELVVEPGEHPTESHTVKTKHIQRRGLVIFDQRGVGEDSTYLTVLLAKNIDPHCPPNDEGHFLVLRPGSWTPE